MRTSTARWTPQPLERDRLALFLLGSLLLHALLALPWGKILWALLGLMGVQPSPLAWKEVDAPTVIPVDLEDLEESAGAPSARGGGAGVAARGGDDAGADAAIEAGVADSEAGADAGRLDGGDDGGDGAADGDGDGGGVRVRDPSALAGGLAGVRAASKELNVSVLVRLDHIRTHPIGKQIGVRLARIPQWRPFFDGTGIDPVQDIDAIFADGPRFYETSRVTARIVHSKPDEDITEALHAIAERTPGSEWIGDDDVPAFRATIDRAPRVFVQGPGLVIVTPPDGETQAFAYVRAMRKKGARGKKLLPNDHDLVVSAYLRKPSNTLRGLPEDLADLRLTVRRRKDEGAVIDVDAKAKSPAQATVNAGIIRELIEGFVPRGLAGMLVRGYVEGYRVSAEGDVIHVHHELDGERVQALWELLVASGY